MFKITKKKVAGLAVASAVLIGGSAAYAYWTSTGTGSGSASAGSSSGLDITQNGSVTGLTPNGTAQTISYTVTNSTSGAEYVGKVTTTVASVSSGSGSGEACDAGMFTIVDGPALNQNLQPGGTASGTATIQLVDDGNNQDNCQGSTVTLAFASN